MPMPPQQRKGQPASAERCLALIGAALMLTWLLSMLWAFESALHQAPRSSSYRSIDALRGFVAQEKKFEVSSAAIGEHDVKELRQGGIPIVVEDEGGGGAPRKKNKLGIERAGLNGELKTEVKAFIQLGLYPPKAEAWASYRKTVLANVAKVLQNTDTEKNETNHWLSFNSSHTEQRRIFIDWPHSTFRFAKHNYASIESMISLYQTRTSQLKLTAIVVAPSKMTQQFRFSNANSYTQLDRYKKLGIDAETRLVDSASQLYMGIPQTNNMPGQLFWKKNRKTQCPKYLEFSQYFANDSNDVIPPAGLTFFLRIQALWREGGIFSDLSLLALRPVSQTLTGYAVAGLGCGPNMTSALYHPRAPPPMLLSFPEPQNKVLACILRAFDDCGNDIQCADMIALQAGKQFRRCFSKEGERNQMSGTVEWLSCRPQQAHNALFSNASTSNDVLLAPLETRLAVWLGPAATNGEWSSPMLGSRLSHLYAQKLPILAPSDDACRAWLLDNPQARFPKCFHFKAPLAGRAAKAITPAELRAAAVGCAPNVIIPAAQKGASSYLFSLLYTHPQTLRPLRGSQYKEPGAYVNSVYFRQAFGRRISRFAFHRHSEALLSLDATVTYATESRLPALRAAFDNPTAKIVFALREPVDRSFSDYRFCYRPFYFRADRGWDQVITSVLPRYQTCYKDRSLTFDSRLNGTSVQEAYYGTLCDDLLLRRADPNGLIRKSIYLPQIQLYATVFGVANVMAVTSEQLRKDATDVAKRVSAFLGLCPFDFQVIPPVHVTPVNPKPEHFWSSSVYEQYKLWIEPFNQMLFDFLGTDADAFGWGSSLKRPTNFRDENPPVQGNSLGHQPKKYSLRKDDSKIQDAVLNRVRAAEKKRQRRYHHHRKPL